MSLHSSFHDYHGFQQTNLFFDSLKTTPPQRLKYFFVPEMDYNGYLHVVRDQEDKAFRKEFRQNQFTACRHENIQKNRERHERRAGFEAALKPGATPQPDVPDQSLTVPGGCRCESVWCTVLKTAWALNTNVGRQAVSDYDATLVRSTKTQDGDACHFNDRKSHGSRDCGAADV